MRAWWLMALLGGPQQAPRVDEVLAQLVENGRRYEAALPSVSCEATVKSQMVRFGRVREEATLEATLTVERTGNAAEPFRESFLWRRRNGAEIGAGEPVKAPFVVGGVFANALGFGSAERVACFDWKLIEKPGSPQARLEMTRAADADRQTACATRVPGMRKTVYVDRASGHVVRLVRTVPAAEAREASEVSFAEVEYAPVALGSETFWLPKRADTHDARDEGRMQVMYSGCRRFAATVKITGGAVAKPELP